MFYRRKILLAFIEAFGGSLSEIDCQNLLLLFCLQRNVHEYDFFPHEYGGYSFVLQQDRKRLEDLGFLASEADFHLCSQQSFCQQLRLEDHVALQVFVEQFGNIRAEKLMRNVYLKYPYYALRSRNVSSLLNHDEYEQVQHLRDSARTPMLFTIGYEGLSIDAYLNILLANNITTLVDVRKNPLSRKYGFSKKKLASFIQTIGLSYLHMPELGVPSALRQDLKSTLAYQNLFEYYASQILPQQQEAIERLKDILQERIRIALTCFEADYHFCHRSEITRSLSNDLYFTTPIRHLGSDCTFEDCIEYTEVSTPALVDTGDALKAS